MIVASVLRSGGDFKPEHVYALQKMCAKYLPPHEFVCLSDVELECKTIPLLHDWVGWWAKMELFRLPSALYFDLDTVLTGDCTAMIEAAKQHDFVIMRDSVHHHYLSRSVECPQTRSLALLQHYICTSSFQPSRTHCQTGS